jgi:serine/threonine protein kinase
MRPSPNDVIGGKYRITRLIGDGGMGAVYEARHEVLGSPVALKFLHAELAKRPGLATRFLQEARVSASIQSPHVTRVTDVDRTADGSPYLVMELLAGESLQDLLDRELKLDRDRSLDFALQILCGLEAAHALGVVHRDLKPDNVFITPSAGGPVLKLLDFGIAKLREANEYKKGLTRPGAVMGTPEYMAPEQLYAADQVDHRADIYSLGAILYEMLSGERPADGDDAPSIIAQVAQGHVKSLDEHVADLAPALVAAVHRALAPNREDRFGSAHEFRAALAPLAGALSHAGRLAATPTPVADAAAGSVPSGGATLPSAHEEPSEGERAPSGVPPTLPPDDGPPGAAGPVVAPTDPDAAALDGAPKGSTQDAPVDALQRLATGAHVASAPAPQPGASANASGGYPAAAPGGAYPAAGGAYGQYAAAPTQPRRAPGRALGAVLALLLGVVVTGAVIAAIVVARQQRDDDHPPTLNIVSGAPPATVSAEGGGLTTPTLGDAGVAPPVTPPTPSPRPGGGSTRPQPRDAGADSGRSDAGGGFPQLPGLPSSLPPLPSTLPTALPSSWEPIPGIQWPPPSQ